MCISRGGGCGRLLYEESRPLRWLATWFSSQSSSLAPADKYTGFDLARGPHGLAQTSPLQREDGLRHSLSLQSALSRHRKCGPVVVSPWREGARMPCRRRGPTTVKGMQLPRHPTWEENACHTNGDWGVRAEEGEAGQALP